VIVAAAGNTGIDASNFQPANCNGVITVAATTSSGNKASYSNYGATVEISAPGSSILSALNTGTTSPASDTYTYYSGTSMAAPHVAGLVSLLLSIDSTLAPDEILQILQNTAKPFPTGSSCTTSICGSGIIDANNAVNFVASSLQYPDLIITDVIIDPPMPATDQPFDVIITIMNQGAVTGPVTIYRDVYIDLDPASTIDPITGCPAQGNYYRSDEFTTFKIGQTDTKTVTVTDGLGFGSHQIWVYVDSQCLVQEFGEENNGQ
jgi:subtilisin family serine protease